MKQRSKLFSFAGKNTLSKFSLRLVDVAVVVAPVYLRRFALYSALVDDVVVKADLLVTLL